MPTLAGPLADLIVDALAAHRLVRLLQRDTLPPIARARAAVLARHPEHPLGELLVCPWCASVHVAAATQLARAVAPRWWPRVAAVLAASSVVGLLAEFEDR